MNKNINMKIMKSKVLGILFLMTFFVTGCDLDETQQVTRFNNLTLSEEFDQDGALDPAIWNFDIGRGQDGWGNQELQYYTDRPENVVVEDGMLKITAIQEDFEGATFTSGRILTQGKFGQKYGRVEARIKLPWGQGLWPAFWMLGANIDTVGWPQCGEIDIMENRGQEPTLIAGSIHGPGYSAAEAITKDFELEDGRFDTDFHIFGIEWGEDYINYYVDDTLYQRLTPEDLEDVEGQTEWVFNQPFFIILNVAVGGSYVGSPSPDTVFPQTMLVDYVRVYSAD
jgi:beta-glucanase (GH16 family)